MRLEMTRKADLACGAMVALSNAGGRAKAAELATTLDSTSGYMPQVLGRLVEAGWVSSGIGPTGGYELVADLDDVSVLAVVEAIDGPTDNGRCVVAGRRCNSAEPCGLHVAWASARTALLAELAATPLSRLAT
jgi:Rrf2 family iron-sulfur cluster assembly transcriptional regulator